MDKTSAFRRTLKKISGLTASLQDGTVASLEARARFADLTNVAAGMANYVEGGDAKLAAAYAAFAQASAYASAAIDYRAGRRTDAGATPLDEASRQYSTECARARARG